MSTKYKISQPTYMFEKSREDCAKRRVHQDDLPFLIPEASLFEDGIVEKPGYLFLHHRKPVQSVLSNVKSLYSHLRLEGVATSRGVDRNLVLKHWPPFPAPLANKANQTLTERPKRYFWTLKTDHQIFIVYDSGSGDYRPWLGLDPKQKPFHHPLVKALLKKQATTQPIPLNRLFEGKGKENIQPRPIQRLSNVLANVSEKTSPKRPPLSGASSPSSFRAINRPTHKKRAYPLENPTRSYQTFDKRRKATSTQKSSGPAEQRDDVAGSRSCLFLADLTLAATFEPGDSAGNWGWQTRELNIWWL